MPNPNTDLSSKLDAAFQAAAAQIETHDRLDGLEKLRAEIDRILLVPRSVKVLLIRNRHGQDAYVHKTEEGVKKSLLDYVDQWWEEDLPDDERPASQDELVTEYFKKMESENYDTFTVPVEE